MSYLECLVVDWVEGLPSNTCLSLGVLAGVREEVGFDVGVRETIAVSCGQISRSVHMDQECSVSAVVAVRMRKGRRGRRSHMIIDKTPICTWNFCIMGRISSSFVERFSSLRRLKCTSIIEKRPQSVSL